jgi:5-methyltetrahydrofolate--homocysteine methyltransferase
MYKHNLKEPNPVNIVITLCRYSFIVIVIVDYFVVIQMNNEEILQRLREGIINFELENIKTLANEAIEAGIPAYQAVMEGLTKGMDIVSERYSKGEAFLSDLIMAGETMEAAMEELEPHLAKSPIKSSGLIILGTVYGDMHDLGKNLVGVLLRSSGFEVIDLGVDVPPEKFVEVISEKNADILALSSLVTTTMPYMEETIKALEKSGLRRKIKVILGGAPVSEAFAEMIGADAYGKDAVDAVDISRKWMKK